MPHAYAIKPTDKWKAASHVQKCIRQGHVEDIAPLARALWNVDNAYLRYRLNVILMEDVGIANMPLVTAMQEDKLNKRWVDKHGGIDYLIQCMQELARGVKDRAPCDWGSIADGRAYSEYVGRDWVDSDVRHAMGIAWDEHAPWHVRGAAVLRATGTDLFPHKNLPTVAGDWVAWVDNQRHQGVSEPVVQAMVVGQKTQREWHPAFLGLCEQSAKNHPQTKTQPCLDMGSVHGYKSSAIDGHTSEGMKAIQQWWRKDQMLRNGWRQLGFSQSDEQAEFLLKKMVFFLEGGMLDQKKVYPASAHTLAYQKERWHQAAGIHAKQAAAIVWAQLPQLHVLRQQYVPAPALLHADEPQNAILYPEPGF